MIDDTREGSPAIPDSVGSFRLEVLELAQLRTDRNDAYVWAGDLKLLAFDDSGPPQYRDSCTRCDLASQERGSEDVDEAQPRDISWACNNCRNGYQDLDQRFH